MTFMVKPEQTLSLNSHSHKLEGRYSSRAVGLRVMRKRGQTKEI